jgi:hypothetical protein
MLVGEIVASRSDVKIRYTGAQLCMADNDVFLQCIFLARLAPLGESVRVNRGAMLRQLGKCDSGNNYQWLDDSIRRLLAASLVVESAESSLRTATTYEDNSDPLPARALGIHLIQRFEFDATFSSYIIELPREIVRLFDGGAYTLVDWDRRMELRSSVPLSKWLQNYASSHSRGKLHRIGIDHLQKWTGLVSPPRKFRASLLSALKELERVGIIGKHQIRANGTVEWWRPP